MTGMTHDVENDAPGTVVHRAIARIEDSRRTHVEWAAHLRACRDCPHSTNVHDAEEQDRIVAEYDEVLTVLRTRVIPPDA